MNLSRLIKERRTIHTYKSKSYPREQLEEALALGLYAPNHKKLWPCTYLEVGPKARVRLAKLHLDMKVKKGSEETPELIQKMEKKYLDPPYLIIIKMTRHNDKDEIVQKENYSMYQVRKTV